MPPTVSSLISGPAHRQPLPLTRPRPPETPPLMKHVPNALTLLRLVLAPVIAWLILEAMFAPTFYVYTPEGERPAFYRDIADTWTLAAALFVVAALTDLFDGMIARAFNAHSKFGRIIDPIADKLLVGLPLIVIALCWNTIDPMRPVVLIATAVIVVRDVSMTVIRIMSPDGEGARVSALAKIKTALELVVIGTYLVAMAIGAHMQVQVSLEDPSGIFTAPYTDVLRYAWLAMLAITAALSAYTALQYLRPKR